MTNDHTRLARTEADLRVAAGMATPAIAPPPAPLPQPEALSQVWWVGCHGGAGTSTLAHLTGVGIDGGRSLPPDPHPGTGVVLVCRASATGSFAAAQAVGAWPQVAPSTSVVGLVVVEASPKRRPRIVKERLTQVAQWIPRVWFVDWHEEFLAAAHPGQVGAPPRIQDIAAALRRLLTHPVAVAEPRS